MCRKISRTACFRKVEEYPKTIEETDDLREERRLPEVVEEEDNWLVGFVLSIWRHKICVGEDREVLFVDISICVERGDENIVCCRMKMRHDFFVELLCRSSDIGSFTNHLIGS